MSFKVATNIIAIRPPERRPTGTPHARANCIMAKSCMSYYYDVIKDIFFHFVD